MKTIKLNSTIMNIKKISTLALIGLFFIACSNDDDKPDLLNEEEVITTMTVTLTPASGGDAIILESRDIDGPNGPKEPVRTVSGNLQANTSYNGSIVLLNETESPAEDITEEVAEKDKEHQFFFSSEGSIGTTTYADEDGDGNPVGLKFTVATTDAGEGKLGITLRHEPKKPNNGTLEDAGGSTDIAQTFDITIE